MSALSKYLLVVVLVAASGVLHAEDPVTMLGKSWQVGYTAQNDQQKLTEYVLPGETVENWTALVTRQFIFDPESKFQLKRFMKLIRSGFPPGCINFTWTIVKQSKTQVLYTWTHDGCANARAESERALMTRVAAGLCRWSYSTRVDPLYPEKLPQLDADLAKQTCD